MLANKQIIANFSAGPGYLPDVVNRKLIDLLQSRIISGNSILEISHRSKQFLDLQAKLFYYLRYHLKIPENYHILLLPGGARAQNAAIPLNCLQNDFSIPVYLNSGIWSKTSAKEALKYTDIINNDITQDIANVTTNSAYYFYTNNETIDGIYYQPNHNLIPHKRIVCDMTSSILIQQQDINNFGIIFAASQKNLGLPGYTLVIIKKSWLNNLAPNQVTPSILDYTKQSKTNSLFNTPSNISWLSGLLLMEWLEQQGGAKQLQTKTIENAKLLYDFLDNSEFYHTLVPNKLRSNINIVFTTKKAQLDLACANFLDDNGIIGLKGHKLVGGLRASCYIGTEKHHIEKLIAMLIKFTKVNK